MQTVLLCKAILEISIEQLWNNSSLNVLYLPLDKMVPNAGQARGAAGRAGVSEREMREIADQVTEQLRRDLDAAAARRGGR